MTRPTRPDRFANAAPNTLFTGISYDCLRFSAEPGLDDLPVGSKDAKLPCRAIWRFVETQDPIERRIIFVSCRSPGVDPQITNLISLLKGQLSPGYGARDDFEAHVAWLFEGGQK